MDQKDLETQDKIAHSCPPGGLLMSSSRCKSQMAVGESPAASKPLYRTRVQLPAYPGTQDTSTRPGGDL